MDDDDGFDLLFNQKLNDSLFDMNGGNLKNLNRKLKESKDELMTFINENLAPEKIDKFKELLEQRDINYFDYSHAENCLYYKNGINDGLIMCLTSLKNKITFTK